MKLFNTKETTMKYFFALLTLLLTTVFAQDFTGTFRDDGGDVHVFEQQSDGTILGNITLENGVTPIIFGIEDGQAVGILELAGGPIAFVLTPYSATQLEIAVVPFDANNQPIEAQVATFILTRTEAQVAQNPLTVQTNAPHNPLSQASSPSLNLGGLELYADGGNSTSNSSSDAHLTSLKTESYLFCSDGTYAYTLEDTTMFSTAGLSGDFSDFSSETSDGHQGWFQVVNGAAGQVVLQLQATDGRIFEYPIAQTSFGIAVGASEFSVSQSSLCP
jgi:hypothetical protein